MNEQCPVHGVNFQVAMIREVMRQMPDEDQGKVQAAYADLASVIEKHGPHGLMALALLGAEKAA